jgi:SAM-dependent methyltransferase
MLTIVAIEPRCHHFSPRLAERWEQFAKRQEAIISIDRAGPDRARVRISIWGTGHDSMNEILKGNYAPLMMKCPACGSALGDFPVRQDIPVYCERCHYIIAWDGDCWDACVDRSYRRDFARQWVLWEAGKLGDPSLVYGKDPERNFRELLEHTRLTEENLKSMRILEIGFGHGRLLQEIQRFCPSAYGLDLSKPLKSAQLRPGSAIFGNLFNIPFEPHQFDLVICRGVIHVTPDAHKAFDCIAEQVADQGLLYCAGLDEPGRGRLLLRKVFPRVWNYPERVRLGISSVSGALRAALEALRERQISAKAFRQNYARFRIGIFDTLAPRWTSTHVADEVKAWYASNGFVAQKVDYGGYFGAKAGHPHATNAT